MQHFGDRLTGERGRGELQKGLRILVSDAQMGGRAELPADEIGRTVGKL
jgi:hypothetical protein